MYRTVKRAVDDLERIRQECYVAAADCMLMDETFTAETWRRLAEVLKSACHTALARHQ
mgnify:CR=1 FL=1